MKFLILITTLLLFLFTATAELVTYPGAYTGVPKSEFYKVTVMQGNTSEEIIVFQNNCPVDPLKSSTNKFLGRTINWTHFSFSDSVVVEVQILNLDKVPLTSATILPSRFGITTETIANDKVKFIINTPGQFSVEIGANGYKNGLMIFADPIETDIPNPDASGWKKLSNATSSDVSNLVSYNALYFEPGVHNIGKLNIPDNINTIYIHGEAWVYGAFILNGNGDSNTKIYGRGVLSQAKFDLRETHSIEATGGANGIKVHGIVVADFMHFALRLITNNNDVNWTKVIGGWAFNNDGYAGYTGSSIKNSFIWANDDNVKLYRDNLVVENLVCWQLDNGAIFQMGWSSVDAKNVRVKNVDVIRAEWSGDRKNNGVISAVIDPGNPTRTETDWIIENVTVETPVTHIFRISPRSAHNINNMTFKNWNVKMNFALNKNNYINGFDASNKISNLNIQNLKINGTCITNTNAVSFAKFNMSNVENINFICGNDVPLSVSISSPENFSKFASGSDVDVTVDVSNVADGSKVEIFVDEILKDTKTSEPFTFTLTGLSDGQHSIRAVYTSDSESLESDPISIQLGSDIIIPGRIEAEDYSSESGTQSESTSDTGGGLNIGFINNGDWLEFSDINVPEAGNYEFNFRVATNNAGGTLKLLINDTEQGSINITNTGGWQNWTDLKVETPVSLSAGLNTIKLLFEGGSGFLFNINYFDVTKISTAIDEIRHGKLQLYPNPAGKSLNIDFNGILQSVSILDLSGKIVYQDSKVYTSATILPVDNLKPGIYFIRCELNGEIHTLKFIKS